MKLKAVFLSAMILSMNLASLEQQSEKLRILVYNTHGLPGLFISDNPKKRFPVIGKKTQDFNISLLQEDYSHHEDLLSGLAKESLAIRGALGGRLICPFCTGSGLTSVFNLPKNWTVDLENQTYDTCSGWFRGANDCFAYKGFQIIKVTLPSNKRLFIVNTHMDAGRRDSDRAAREKQLEHIISTIKQRTTAEALIIAGDLNLNSKNPEDVKLLESFKEELRLTDSFTGHKISNKWTILDYILYKQGEELEFKSISVGEDESFITKEGPLSDHPALIIELLI
tara:strand:+ start:186 stop:1031 length:846 start_codon:yes stop_codon:yes gene_type:complete